jgi:hypothetical protein
MFRVALAAVKAGGEGFHGFGFEALIHSIYVGALHPTAF